MLVIVVMVIHSFFENVVTMRQLSTKFIQEFFEKTSPYSEASISSVSTFPTPCERHTRPSLVEAAAWQH